MATTPVAATGNDVVVRIVADLQALFAPLQQATGIVASATSAIQNQFAAVAKSIEAIKAPVVAVAGLLAGGAIFGKTVSDATQFATTVNTLARTLGSSREEATALAKAFEKFGVSTEQTTMMSRRLSMALRTREAELYANGVATRDANGQLLSQQEIMLNGIARLKQLKEGNDQNQLAMMMFGARVGDLGKIMKVTEEQIRKSAEEAEKWGITVSPEKVAQVNEYKVAVHEFKEVFENFATMIGQKVIPELTKLAKWFAGQIDPTAVRGTVDSVIDAFGKLRDILSLTSIQVGLVAMVLVGPLRSAFGSASRSAISFATAYREALSDVYAATQVGSTGIVTMSMRMNAAFDALILRTGSFANKYREAMSAAFASTQIGAAGVVTATMRIQAAFTALGITATALRAVLATMWPFVLISVITAGAAALENWRNSAKNAAEEAARLAEKTLHTYDSQITSAEKLRALDTKMKSGTLTEDERVKTAKQMDAELQKMIARNPELEKAVVRVNGKYLDVEATLARIEEAETRRLAREAAAHQAKANALREEIRAIEEAERKKNQSRNAARATAATLMGEAPPEIEIQMSPATKKRLDELNESLRQANEKVAELNARSLDFAPAPGATTDKPGGKGGDKAVVTAERIRQDKQDLKDTIREQELYGEEATKFTEEFWAERAKRPEYQKFMKGQPGMRRDQEAEIILDAAAKGKEREAKETEGAAKTRIERTKREGEARVEVQKAEAEAEKERVGLNPEDAAAQEQAVAKARYDVRRAAAVEQYSRAKGDNKNYTDAQVRDFKDKIAQIDTEFATESKTRQIKAGTERLNINRALAKQEIDLERDRTLAQSQMRGAAATTGATAYDRGAEAQRNAEENFNAKRLAIQKEIISGKQDELTLATKRNELAKLEIDYAKELADIEKKRQTTAIDRASAAATALNDMEKQRLSGRQSREEVGIGEGAEQERKLTEDSYRVQMAALYRRRQVKGLQVQEQAQIDEQIYNLQITHLKELEGINEQSYSKMFAKMGNYVAPLREAIVETYDSIITKTRSFSEVMLNMLRSLGRAIVSEFANTLTKPITSALTEGAMGFMGIQKPGSTDTSGLKTAALALPLNNVDSTLKTTNEELARLNATLSGTNPVTQKAGESSEAVGNALDDYGNKLRDSTSETTANKIVTVSNTAATMFNSTALYATAGSGGGGGGGIIKQGASFIKKLVSGSTGAGGGLPDVGGFGSGGIDDYADSGGAAGLEQYLGLSGESGGVGGTGVVSAEALNASEYAALGMEVPGVAGAGSGMGGLAGSAAVADMEGSLAGAAGSGASGAGAFAMPVIGGAIGGYGLGKMMGTSGIGGAVGGGIGGAVGTLFGPIGSMVGGLVGGALGSVVEKFGPQILDAAKDAGEWTVNAAKDAGEGFLSAVQSAGSFLLDGLKTIGGGAWEGIKGIGGFLGDIGKGIGDFFGGLFAEGGRPPIGIPSLGGEKGPELFVPDRKGGRVGIIGERGPALFTPRESGIVIPADQSKAMLAQARKGEGAVAPIGGQFASGSGFIPNVTIPTVPALGAYAGAYAMPRYQEPSPAAFNGIRQALSGGAAGGGGRAGDTYNVNIQAIDSRSLEHALRGGADTGLAKSINRLVAQRRL